MIGHPNKQTEINALFMEYVRSNGNTIYYTFLLFLEREMRKLI